MYRRLSATPCPATAQGGAHGHRGRRDSILDASNDTTANIDFTTEFKASFRDVKPKRPPNSRRAPMAPTNFTIHEDEELQVDNATFDHGDFAAQREPPGAYRRVSFIQTNTDAGEYSKADRARRTSLSKAPRRQSLVHHQQQDDTLPVVVSPKISKPARRGTIYIPSEDTTMPTMFMDIFSPLKNPGAAARSSEAQNGELTGLERQMIRKRAGRKSILASSPKRVPLQPSKKLSQPAGTDFDRPGNVTGKENIPPGYALPEPKECFKSAVGSVEMADAKPAATSTLTRPSATSRMLKPTASSAARLKDNVTAAKPRPKAPWNSNFLLPKTHKRIAAESVDDTRPAPVITESKPDCDKRRVPSRFVVPNVQVSVENQYKFLPEGLADASMYEENWLSQQEVAMTQLANSLLETTSRPSSVSMSPELDRLALMELYGNPDMSLLFKRVQGSLLYGALSIPRDQIGCGQQLYADLGRRRDYTNFWLATYEHRFLKTALEVVVGRIIPLRISADANHESTSGSLNDRSRPIQTCLEKFMIRNEDLSLVRTSSNSAACSYQRTVLRSLMLIKVLDLIKTDKTLQTQGNLFQSSSKLKSSPEAVIELMRMLNPSAGDPSRPLKNLGYAVSHAQYPLEEFQYQITSLAVDMRDGVRLTRLVEILLYRSASPTLALAHDVDANTTLTIPTGETVCLTDGNPDWPISQYLKLPCISRATKIYNVELALAAIREVRGMGGLLKDITGSDIVDGFREKTVRLLWGLCSKWGLGGLVDWDDVKSEIKRLARARGLVGNSHLTDLDLEEEDNSHTVLQSLLKAWVRGVAAVHGHRVRNFTTDFADGKLFGAIVQEYQPLMSSHLSQNSEQGLSDRLRDLGCSNEFAKLFDTRGSAGQQIFDRDFVLASIAFLCSRLLRPSKFARAATVLQRAWRRRWEKTLAERRQMVKVLAVDCVQYVQATKAKKVIWRTWCSYRNRRRARGVTSTKRVVEADIWLSL